MRTVTVVCKPYNPKTRAMHVLAKMVGVDRQCKRSLRSQRANILWLQYYESRRFAVSRVIDMICVGCSCHDTASILTLAPSVHLIYAYIHCVALGEKAEPNVASCASI